MAAGRGSEPAIIIGKDGTPIVGSLSWQRFQTNLWKGTFGSTPTFQGAIDAGIEPGVAGGGDEEYGARLRPVRPRLWGDLVRKSSAVRDWIPVDPAQAASAPSSWATMPLRWPRGRTASGRSVGAISGVNEQAVKTRAPRAASMKSANRSRREPPALERRLTSWLAGGFLQAHRHRVSEELRPG